MTVKEFVGLLDKLSPKVQVVLFMVQCHSGGFWDVIFKGADVGPVLAEATRCGFFATWSDRLAAGCTPDTAEENYKDYTTYFFAALSGQDAHRSGGDAAGLRPRWTDVDGRGARVRVDDQRHDRHPDDARATCCCGSSARPRMRR